MREAFLSKDELSNALNLSHQHYSRIFEKNASLHPSRCALLGYIIGDVIGTPDRNLAPAPVYRAPVQCRNDRHPFWRWMSRTGLKTADDAAGILLLTTSRIHDFTSWSKGQPPRHITRLMAYRELDITGTIDAELAQYRWFHQMRLPF